MTKPQDSSRCSLRTYIGTALVRESCAIDTTNILSKTIRPLTGLPCRTIGCPAAATKVVSLAFPLRLIPADSTITATTSVFFRPKRVQITEKIL